MFIDRRDAGRQLGERLARLAAERPIVIAMPRGGVPVAAEIAARLDAPLDVLVVRKLGSPWQPELGVGALAEGDVRVLNERLIGEIGISPPALDEVTAHESAELARRVARYRGTRAPLDVAGRAVILVDDGLATGYTARAAIEALRRRGAQRVVLAVPVGPQGLKAAMGSVADEVVALETPRSFFAIGEFYLDFGQTTDEEVVRLLAGSGGDGNGGAPGH